MLGLDGGKLVFQFFKIVIGFVFALLGCGMFLAWGFCQAAHPQDDVVAFATMFGTGLVSASVIGAAALIPAGIAIAVSEFGRFRGVLFHMAAGGGVAFLLWTLGSPDTTAEIRPGSSIALAGGFLAGAIYWSIAGRTAGSWLAKTESRPDGPE
ncbi:MAG: translation initiation factor IF-3 [Roseibium sp.]